VSPVRRACERAHSSAGSSTHPAGGSWRTTKTSSNPLGRRRRLQAFARPEDADDGHLPLRRAPRVAGDRHIGINVDQAPEEPEARGRDVAPTLVGAGGRVVDDGRHAASAGTLEEPRLAMARTQQVEGDAHVRVEIAVAEEGRLRRPLEAAQDHRLHGLSSAA
jgi:hypothetical protein